MDKQIIQAIYANAVSRESIRPLMTGIHFEKNRCYASDTHILIVYNQGSEELEGKTINVNGEQIKGNYPNIERVIPKNNLKNVNIDLDQLHRACQWYMRSDFGTPDDEVLIEDVAVKVSMIYRLLNIFKVGKTLKNTKFYVTDPTRPVVFKNAMFTGIIMPCSVNIEFVDMDPLPDERRTISYANLINTFAFEGWKKPETDRLSWLK